MIYRRGIRRGNTQRPAGTHTSMRLRQILLPVYFRRRPIVQAPVLIKIEPEDTGTYPADRPVPFECLTFIYPDRTPSLRAHCDDV